MTRIDKRDLSVKQIKMGEAPWGVAVDTTHVWTSNYYDDTVTRISKYDYSITKIKVGEEPYGIAMDGNYVWVTNGKDNTLSRIDKSDLSVTEIAAGSYPVRIASGYVFDYTFLKSTCRSVEVTEPSADVTITQGETVPISWNISASNTANSAPASLFPRRQKSSSPFRPSIFMVEPVLLGKATVSFYYDTDTDFAGDGKALIENGTLGDDSFLWDTAGVTPGTYYIAASVDDGLCMDTAYALAAVTITAPIMETDEGFEGGDFEKHPWLHGGDQPWDIVSDTQYEGTYSAESGIYSRQ